MDNIPKKVIETYKNIYFGPLIKMKEKFQETTSTVDTTSTTLVAPVDTSSSTPSSIVSGETSSSSTTPSSIVSGETSSSSTTPSSIVSGETSSSTTTTKSSDDSSDNEYDPLFSLIAWIIFFFAIYLSFRCNQGFSFWGFLGAFFFSPIYIIYKLSADYKMCKFK